MAFWDGPPHPAPHIRRADERKREIHDSYMESQNRYKDPLPPVDLDQDRKPFRIRGLNDDRWD